MTAIRTAAAILVVPLFLAGCSASPTIPSATSSVAPAAPTPPPSPTAAVLVISGFTAATVPVDNDVTNAPYKFVYRVRFALSETGGTSGATIQNIETAVVDPSFSGSTIRFPSFNTGPECWQDLLRVPPGGTLETFATDEGADWLGYCSPDPASVIEARQVALIVTFTDDEGHSSTVQALANVTR